MTLHSLKGKACGKIDLSQCVWIFRLDLRGLTGRVYRCTEIGKTKIGKRIYSHTARRGNVSSNLIEGTKTTK